MTVLDILTPKSRQHPQPPEPQQNETFPSLSTAAAAIANFAGCTTEFAQEFIKWLDDNWVYHALQHEEGKHSRLIINGEYVRFHDLLDKVFPDYSCPLPGGVGDIVQRHLGQGTSFVSINHYMTGPGPFNYCKVDLRVCVEVVQ